MRLPFFFMLFLLSFPARAEIGAIVENFSFAGCAAPGQADETLLSMRAAAPRVLVLTCHDGSLAEKVPDDALPSQNACKKRRFDYLHVNSIYATNRPLLMINGAYDATGQYPAILRTGVDMALAVDRLGQAELSRNADGLAAALPDLPETGAPRGKLDLLLLIYRPGVLTDSASDVTVINPVMAIQSLGDWDGRARNFTVKPEQDGAGLAFLLIAQDTRSGPVRLAGHLAPE